MSNTPDPFPVDDAEQLQLIPLDDLPEWFEVVGKGAAITTKPHYGKRVTMVMTGIVDGMKAKEGKFGTEITFSFTADRSQFIDPGTVVDATNARMLEQLEEFITAEDFDAHETVSIEAPSNVDPETGEKLDDDDGDGDVIDGDFGPKD